MTAALPETAWMPRDAARSAESQVREWLAARTGIAATELPLQRDTQDRPRLGGALDGHDISWSHSGDGLLLAFGTGVTLGVDMEWPHGKRKVAEIARRYFTPDEQAWLAVQSDAAARDHAFHRLWCAKEAVLKAHGHGLSFGLDRLQFAEIDGALRLDHADHALGEAASWRLHEWSPAPGYLAALAWRPR
ncbi:4'-phosphopantetheinyl transferase family protein [Solilutibacter silvestris]|uniref:Phosphopantetheinyl transferase n=1 Tax=Solilutibacter silvestris TaxID=1645665 RepID=A0A2K1Q0N5_9GAMM|nr:4'-phosphopantetheinyl transferase superfamily protein [Lysobacter silvestris]PNS08605.1 Phosphopantetheinyl transferase [Lysobacter silvestris]